MTNEPLWLWMLRKAVDASSQVKVAKRLGVARSAVSMSLSGRYPASTAQLERKIMGKLGEPLLCPHTQAEVTVTDCYQIGGSAKPPANRPLELPHWHACQVCPHSVKRKGDAGEKKD
ncbi:transcriptional regulator [Pandoraea sp. SD6-2]|uniref:transcriptional regulator n=1 Tax=Pandoraea sp. SD6-2 TaxID=1286093 RepID=UPI00032FA4BA|nr:transcriptional regulator [Pandoraea sp. SD6-2]EON13062.1 regulatory protein, LacI [Pandoraea sp. SD6-2]